MTVRRGTAMASSAVAAAVAVALASSGRAETAAPSKDTATPTAMPTMSASAARERPRGVVENCRRISGFGGSLRDFTRGGNLVVGPLAVLHAGATLSYSHAAGGNKLFVLVRGGHRVTLELSRRTRRDAGLALGPYPDGDIRLRDTRRVVTFIACRRGENSDPHLDAWPVSGWVGGLLARSPRCVPLLVWVDDEHSPRRAVIRFGVPRCG